LIVDGEAMLDPSNPEIKPERDPDESELEVSATPPLLTQWQDVEHGTVHLHDYFSKPLKRLRKLRVYTPPGYEAKGGERFPVLYLMHGTGDTEATWTDFGRAHFIEDNLLAQKSSLPMIIVMTDGHADLADEEGIGRRNLEKMEDDLMGAVVPLIDRTYRTLADRDHRAICGLSMGGFQSMFIGLRQLDSFAWVCGMSAYVPNVEALCAPALNDPKTNERLRLFWHEIGKDDFLLPQQQLFEATLAKHGIKHDFHVTEGNHSWPVWRGYLGELLPRLFRS
jgi:enterochelin esterase-like enzyme